MSRIFIVDDEDAIRSVLSTALTAKGYSIDTAGDGDEAMERLKTESFDLLLLDIKMVKVNGLEVLKFVKRNFPETKVIMLTAFADLRNALESKKLGADDFISKPYDLDDLTKCIEVTLAK